ncbi:MAG: putative virulence factor [Muribaculum sp.]|nr:putative virulence factor [Muribaculum sp.]
MLQQINIQIQNIGRALEWLRLNRPEQYDARFLDLVEERRRLRKIASALREKPAIAAFGESQKGKSYLIGNLLQKNKKPFTVRSGEDGSEVNFVQSINPIGDKKEATGVVTRFTSFTPGSSRFSPKYPVIVKLFSPANLVTILTDSYYSDISDYQNYSEAEIQAFSQALLEKYASRPEIPDAPLCEDDILEIKHYLSKFAQAPTQTLRRSGYFDNLARVIRRVPESELVDVLRYLWHENAVISDLFSRLAGVLRRLKYAPEVYTSIEDVRHYGDNRNTFMSVDCLNELDLPEPTSIARIHVPDGLGGFTDADVPKCELCALCAEAIFNIDGQYLTDSETYASDGEPGANGNIPAESLRKLSPKVDKSLLRDMDLLDFPGARNRLKIKAEFLSKHDREEGASNAVQMLLRGKVAFLFNNYNDSRAINMLLFCHDNEQPAVTDMYSMVDSWVKKYVGDTPERRRQTVDRYGGLSPLFVVCTKFNVDMIEKDNLEHNNLTSLNQRWDGRFMKVLYTQVFKGDSVDWFNNWTAPSETFKNTYMLRDFKYSGCTGSGNNLYDGYSETDPLPRENNLILSKPFYADLRGSFISNSTVKKFFADPALAWDAAATRNNDGALFIIDNLTRAAVHAAGARTAQFADELHSCSAHALALMQNYHIDDDLDKILQDNLRKSAAVMRELDFTTNTDNYFFGHLLQGMMMTESETLAIVHRLVQSSELVNSTLDWKEYELIRRRCSDFKGCTSADQKWDRLIQVYFFRDRDDADRYLTRRGVDYNILFSDKAAARKNSTTLAENVVKAWTDKLYSPAFKNTFTSDSGFDPLVLSDLVDSISRNAESLGLTESMGSDISEYVDVVNVQNANESLIADILTDSINDFVNDMGYSRLTLSERANADTIIKGSPLAFINEQSDQSPKEYGEEEISALFDMLNDNPAGMPPSFDNHYYRWLKYMTAGFIARIQVPDYDREANEKLSTLLADIKSVKY